MVTNEHRFHNYNGLRTIYRYGQSVKHPDVVLRYMPNAKLQSYRVAVVVSRKVSKSAVVRNRIRRRIYEIVHKHEERINKQFDLVYIVYSDNLENLNSPELEDIIIGELKQGGAMT